MPQKETIDDAVRRSCLAVIRRSARDCVGGEAYREACVDESGPEEHVLRFEGRQRLRRALRRLPSRDQVLLMVLAESPSPPWRDIGRRLDMPVSSIGSTRQRTLARLRQELIAVSDAGGR